MEIEQRISSFPVCGLKEQEQHEAESLNTKLQLLKNRLVTVQLQLQERHCEDQVHTHTLIHPELSLLPTKTCVFYVEDSIFQVYVMNRLHVMTKSDH